MITHLTIVDSNDYLNPFGETLVSAVAKPISGMPSQWRTSWCNLTPNAVSYPSGDVKFWFVAGQSNAANVGTMNGAYYFHRSYYRNVYHYYDGELFDGVSPFRGATGPDGWNSFQKVAFDYCDKHPTTSVVLAFFSVGEQSIDKFAPGGVLHSIMISELSAFTSFCQSQTGRPKIDNFLWQQGEADAFLETSAPAYLNAFNSMAGVLDTYTNNINVARSTYYGSPAGWDYNNSTGVALDILRSSYPGPDTDTLTGTTNRPDGTHFGNQGSINMSILWNEYL